MLKYSTTMTISKIMGILKYAPLAWNYLEHSKEQICDGTANGPSGHTSYSGEYFNKRGISRSFPWRRYNEMCFQERELRKSLWFELIRTHTNRKTLSEPARNIPNIY